MDFNNKLKPVPENKPKAMGFAEILRKLGQAGVKIVKEDMGGSYIVYTDPNTKQDLLTTAFTPETFNMFKEAILSGQDMGEAVKNYKSTFRKNKDKQPKPEFTETVTPLSYNEKGGVATENKPSMVRKVK